MKSLFEGIIAGHTLKILLLFVGKPEEFYHINKVAADTGVPVATTFRIMKRLVSQDVIETKAISKFKIYRLARNEKAARLSEILK
jgi:hypothetical protein